MRHISVEGTDPSNVRAFIVDAETSGFEMYEGPVAGLIDQHKVDKDDLLVLPTTGQSAAEVPAGVSEELFEVVTAQAGAGIRNAATVRVAAKIETGRNVNGSRPFVLTTVDEQLAEAFDGTKARMVSSAVAYRRPGTYLAVRYDQVELAHVTGDGLYSWRRVLDRGIGSIMAANNTEIAEFVERVAESAANEARDSILATGASVEKEITVHGVGARMPGLDEQLEMRMGESVVVCPDGMPTGLPDVAPAAWQAHQLAGWEPPAESLLVNPVARQERLNKEAARETRYKQVVFAGLGLFLLILGTTPYLLAALNKASAQSRFDDAASAFTLVADNDTAAHIRAEGRSLDRETREATVDWPSTIDWLMVETTPPGADWQNVRLATEDRTVTLEGSVAVAGTYEELAGWVELLETEEIVRAWVPTWSADPVTGGVRATIEIDTGWSTEAFPASLEAEIEAAAREAEQSAAADPQAGTETVADPSATDELESVGG